MLQLLLLPQTPHKDRAPGPGTINPQFNSGIEVKKVWMGTELPHLQELGGRLGQ